MQSSKDGKRVCLSRVAAWSVVGLTGFAYLLNYADRQVIFSIFPVLKSELGFSDTQLGLTSAAFLWVYGVCSPLAGHAADRVPKSTLVCLSLMAWSAVTFLTGVARSAPAVLLLRGLMGLTEAFFVPAAVAAIASAHNSATRSLAIGLLFSAQVAGLVVGGWCGGFVTQVCGWRAAFYLLGGVGAIYAIPYYLFLRKTISERGAAPRRLSVRCCSHWMDLLRTPTYVWLCIAFPTYTALLWLLYTWLPTFLFEKFQLSLADAGFTATAYLQVASLAGLICGGVLADRLSRWAKAGRFWVLCGGMMLSSPWAHIVAHSNELRIVKLALMAFGFFGGMFMANLMASALDVVASASRGTAVGLVNCVGTPVSGFAAWAAGALKARIGVANVISGGALTAVIAGLLLTIAVKIYFTEDYERANAKTEATAALGSLDVGTCSGPLHG